jgi:hypothetical protein
VSGTQTLMAKKDLRVLFSTNAASLDAEQTFVNREGEREAFQRAFAAHGTAVDSGSCDPEDVVVPRRNVIVYYGVGGIGKTTLSRQLEAWLGGVGTDLPSGWPAHDGGGVRTVTARLELSREAGLDVETMLLCLRASLAGLGKPMLAFDVVFSRYWAQTHPSEQFSDYLRRNTLFSRMATAMNLPDQLANALADVGGHLGNINTAASVLSLTGRSLVSFLRDRSNRRHVLASCPRVADLLEAGADSDAVSYYPYLLAWDIHRRQRDDGLRLVVFLDTFEDAGTRNNRELERFLQRMVWLMPNVFFVVTGRNRLEWADARLAGQLDWVGAVSWPGLAPGSPAEPRQHLVGALSDRDCDQFLRDRLHSGGHPLIPAPVRDRIVANSAGLPLYLDLSVLRFAQMHSDGTTPAPTEFDTAFPVLVARVFRDLGPDERDVLRAVSLLDGFDVALATTVAGLTGDGAALRLLDRPFVRFDPAAPLPYQLDDLVRGRIRDADTGLDDSWTPADWQRAAARAFAALGRRAVPHDPATGPVERRILISSLNEGLRLADEYSLDFDWLVDAAYRFATDHVWEATLRPRIVGVGDADHIPLTTPAAALALALTAISDRQRAHRQTTADTLRRCLDVGLLTGDAADLVGYFHAECMRDLGQLTVSERGMQALIGPGRRMSEAASKGLAHLQRRLGRFRALHADLISRAPGAVTARLTGDLWWTQARLDLADGSYTAARDLATAAGLSGEAALCEACRAFAAGFGAPAHAADVVDSAQRMLADVNITWADLQVRNGQLLAAAGTPTDDQQTGYDAVVAAARTAGLTSIAAYAEFAHAFDTAVRDDRSGLLAAHRRILTLAHQGEFGYLADIVTFWLTRGELEPATLASTVEWIDRLDVTARRWWTVVEQRRADLQAGTR